VHDEVRAAVAHLEDDRYFHPDIAAADAIVRSGKLRDIAEAHGVPIPSVIHG
jgi:histidine ammonia-lyase